MYLKYMKQHLTDWNTWQCSNLNRFLTYDFRQLIDELDSPSPPKINTDIKELNNKNCLDLTDHNTIFIQQ